MLRPSPNHRALRLPNDDDDDDYDDDGCMNPPNVPDCSVQLINAFCLSQKIPLINTEYLCEHLLF